MSINVDTWHLGDGEYGHFWGDTLYARPPFKDPIIEHLLYERDVVCISSAPGIGKTMLALQLMCCLTTGKAFLNTYKVQRPCNVLYVQTEGDRSETLERLDLMTRGVPIDNTRWSHVNLPGMMLNDPTDYAKFVELVRRNPMMFNVVIIDPLYTTVNGSLNADDVATAWIRNMRTFRAEYDCAIIVLHHDAKDLYSDGVVVDRGNNVTYGSVFWQAFFNQNFKIKLRKDVYSLDNGKQRSGKIIDKVEMVLIDEPLMFTNISEESDANSFIVKAAIDRGPRAGMSAKGIIKATGLSKSSAYRTLKRLEDSKQVDTFHTPTGVLYRVHKEAAHVA